MKYLACLLIFSCTATAVSAQEIVDNWKYTLRRPAKGWQTPNFEPQDWQNGSGGFGTVGTPNARIGTVWATNGIWLRKSIPVKTIPKNPALLIHHDENRSSY